MPERRKRRFKTLNEDHPLVKRIRRVLETPLPVDVFIKPNTLRSLFLLSLALALSTGLFVQLTAKPASVYAQGELWTDGGAYLYPTNGESVRLGDEDWIGIGSSAERIVFDTAGDISVMGAKVGIGTTSPGYGLHVSGSGGTSAQMRLTRDSGAEVQYLAGTGAGALGTMTNHPLQFKTNSAVNMVITSTGNVGIGTTSLSSYKLEVQGGSSTAIYGQSTNGYGVYGYSSGSNGRGVYGYSSGSSSHGVYGYSSGGGSSAGVYGTGVGRGVYGYSPTGAGVYGYSGATSGVGVMGSADNGVEGWGSEIGVMGVGAAGGYDFYAVGPGTDYGSSSSIRWKNNVTPIGNALKKVINLNGVYFDWDKKHGGQHDVGMIAEDVGRVVPEIVSYEEDGSGYATGMDYGRLTPLLVEAIKELSTKITATLGKIKATTIEVANSIKTATLTVTTKLTAAVADVTKIKVETLEVKGEKVGEAVLPAGQTSIVITNSLVTNHSYIFATPRVAISTSLAVTEIKEGTSFTIEITEVQDVDIPFHWWIVEADPNE